MHPQNDKKRILLHSCCGPCCTAVIRRLLQDYDVSVFFYNPNITDTKEYALRKAEQIRFLEEFCLATGETVDFIEGDYHPAVYYNAVKGLEQEPEGGLRCNACFKLRLEQTAKKAKDNRFDCFDTTLSVSPHKNFKIISGIGHALAHDYSVQYVGGNYKKQDGFKISIDMSNEYKLYRQHYCGCSFSEARP